MAYSSALSSFTFDSTQIAAVGSVAFSMQRAPLDVTSIGCWNTYHIDGVASAAFTLDVYYTFDDHTKLISDIFVPSGANRPLTFSITLGVNGATTDTISGRCIVTSMDVVTSTADVVRGSFACQIVGPVSVNGNEADTGNAEVVPTPA